MSEEKGKGPKKPVVLTERRVLNDAKRIVNAAEKKGGRVTSEQKPPQRPKKGS